MRKLLYLFLVLLPVNTMAADLPKGIIEVTPRPAPALSLKNLDGDTTTLGQASKRWAFVHFWASWCGPCRREMPAIQSLVKKMQGSGIDFYIVNTAESEDTVFSFLGAYAPDINSLLDRDGLATEQWQPRGLPSTYLVDPGGMIRYVVIGGQDWNQPAYTGFLGNLAGQDL